MKESDEKTIEKSEEIHIKDEEKLQENHEQGHHEESRIIHFIETICLPVLYPLEKIMPINKMPELAFFIIVCIYFMSTDFILKIVSVMSVYTNLSHIFVGITFMSWGSSAIEMINLTIAVKKNEMQLGLTSIMSALVFAFLMIMPAAMIFKMFKRDSNQMEVLLNHHTSHELFIPAILVTITVALVFWRTKMTIGKGGSYILIAAYILYLIYAFLLFFNDKT